MLEWEEFEKINASVWQKQEAVLWNSTTRTCAPAHLSCRCHCSIGTSGDADQRAEEHRSPLQTSEDVFLNGPDWIGIFRLTGSREECLI